MKQQMKRHQKKKHQVMKQQMKRHQRRSTIKEEAPSNEATNEVPSKKTEQFDFKSEVDSEVLDNSKQGTDNDNSSNHSEDNIVTYAEPTALTNTVQLIHLLEFHLITHKLKSKVKC